MACGCGEKKEAMTSAQLTEPVDTSMIAPVTQTMRERREAELSSVRAAIANSRG